MAGLAFEVISILGKSKLPFKQIKADGRKARDKKFGYGGRKSLQKQNDAKSSADDSGWRQGKFGKFSSGKKIGKKGSKNRPGKARRQAMQARKHSMG